MYSKVIFSVFSSLGLRSIEAAGGRQAGRRRRDVKQVEAGPITFTCWTNLRFELLIIEVIFISTHSSP